MRIRFAETTEDSSESKLESAGVRCHSIHVDLAIKYFQCASEKKIDSCKHFIPEDIISECFTTAEGVKQKELEVKVTKMAEEFSADKDSKSSLFQTINDKMMARLRSKSTSQEFFGASLDFMKAVIEQAAVCHKHIKELSDTMASGDISKKFKSLEKVSLQMQTLIKIFHTNYIEAKRDVGFDLAGMTELAVASKWPEEDKIGRALSKSFSEILKRPELFRVEKMTPRLASSLFRHKPKKILVDELASEAYRGHRKIAGTRSASAL
ncbi:hypothetical protein RF11_05955 [Thelohanellus kitauei]|uniref:Uncharacterized protein n=1 Tax=Thelohanellus kitauei TaxID=669202 RepID=A0A0C2II05_THEKT|nr:hypothetical protein RF11_05955 [Thelohanellus kitauei]